MAVRVTPANSFMHSIGRGTIDLLADTINVALISSVYDPAIEWPAWQSAHAYTEGEIIKRLTGYDQHAFECTVAGNSAGGEPSWNTSAAGGSTTTDNEVTWTDLGINSPLFEVANVGFISLPTVWSALKVVTINDFYVPLTGPNGHVYEATTGGTTDMTTEPTWPTDRTTVADGSVIWTDRGMNPGASEVTGTGYVQAGEEIITKTLTNDPTKGRRTFWDGVDVTWATSTITARWGCMYANHTRDSVIKPFVGMILFNDAPADVGSVAADFIIKWNTEGILRLRATLI